VYLTPEHKIPFCDRENKEVRGKIYIRPDSEYVGRFLYEAITGSSIPKDAALNRILLFVKDNMNASSFKHSSSSLFRNSTKSTDSSSTLHSSSFTFSYL